MREELDDTSSTLTTLGESVGEIEKAGTNSMDAGSIFMLGNGYNKPIVGALPCTGGSYSPTSYPTLFDRIGYSYGGSIGGSASPFEFPVTMYALNAALDHYTGNWWVCAAPETSGSGTTTYYLYVFDKNYNLLKSKTLGSNSKGYPYMKYMFVAHDRIVWGQNTNYTGVLAYYYGTFDNLTEQKLSTQYYESNNAADNQAFLVAGSDFACAVWIYLGLNQSGYNTTSYIRMRQIYPTVGTQQTVETIVTPSGYTSAIYIGVVSTDLNIGVIGYRYNNSNESMSEVSKSVRVQGSSLINKTTLTSAGYFDAYRNGSLFAYAFALSSSVKYAMYFASDSYITGVASNGNMMHIPTSGYKFSTSRTVGTGSATGFVPLLSNWGFAPSNSVSGEGGIVLQNGGSQASGYAGGLAYGSALLRPDLIYLDVEDQCLRCLNGNLYKTTIFLTSFQFKTPLLTESDRAYYIKR